MISVIMPVYLGKYPLAAKNREQKLIRAINSVINQTYKDWELIIVCDGCADAYNICKPFVNGKIKLFKIAKQPMWSGTPRNVGITKSKGGWITYLDSDDFFGENHLMILSKQLGDKDWYFFDDIKFNNDWYVSHCFLEKSHCGTSNIIHKKIEYWENESKYSYDDWYFIRKLMEHNYQKITAPEYYVAHIPNEYDC